MQNLIHVVDIERTFYAAEKFRSTCRVFAEADGFGEEVLQTLLFKNLA